MDPSYSTNERNLQTVIPVPVEESDKVQTMPTALQGQRCQRKRALAQYLGWNCLRGGLQQNLINFRCVEHFFFK
jgi:hypothetical protein